MRNSGDAHGETSINRHRLASDVVVCNEREHEVGDLIGSALAMERDSVIQVKLALLFIHGFVEVGADHAWGDAVHADVVIGELAGKSAGELRKGALGDLVGNVGDDASNTCGGRDQD